MTFGVERSYDVFVAHSKDSMPFTAQLTERLRAAGLKVFFDERELEHGGAYDTAIRKAVHGCGAFLFVSSPRSVKKESYALTELTWAIESGRNLFGICAPRHDQVEPPPAVKARTLIRSNGDRIATAVSTLSDVRSRARYRIAAALGLAIVVALMSLAALNWPSDGIGEPHEKPTVRGHPADAAPARSVPTITPLEPPRSGMARITGTKLSIGVGPEGREAFLAWCARNEPDGKNCEQMLGRMEPRSADIETFDIDTAELSEERLKLWIIEQIAVHAAAVSGAEVRRQSDGVVLWEPACHGLGSYQAANGTLEPVNAKSDGHRPAVCVSAYAAAWYCESHGMRLPRDEEWELAAGGASKRWLPWDPTGQAMIACSDAVFGRFQKGRCADRPRNPEPSASFGKDRTPEGALNLAGNVSEWVERRIGEKPTFLARGGNWSGLAIDLHPTKVMRIDPGIAKYATVGFRCARTPEKAGGS